ncbi:hypothetical protein ACVCNH_05860 [Achromobacter anxifer]
MKGEAGVAAICISLGLTRWKTGGGKIDACRRPYASIIGGKPDQRVALFQHGGILVWERPGKP